ncbi:YceD family protein [Schlegelella sp. S2-27]|uniref:Large ribosomal RNA subunit accumulation protein YceD n=1 Tax=Caldimonas mangrovi TaxID=2944811 RepID=A0ABT0YQC0_9BURK|nr:YceD family protein [Caldimonas mangrovi]MCM5680848.1 YceD family protein [Caldimonas mangrovi]
MKAREFDPLRLDVQEFARAAASLQGQWVLTSMPRLAASQHEDAAVQGREVVWSATGERVERTGAEAQTWLHLEARTAVALECQRCLRPIEERIEAERSFRFVTGETQAEALDADSEEDVLAMTRTLDLRELIEDELILALPLVPRHDRCPVSLPAASAPEAPAAGAEKQSNPFAVLAQLKKGRPS